MFFTIKEPLDTFFSILDFLNSLHVFRNCLDDQSKAVERQVVRYLRILQFIKFNISWQYEEIMAISVYFFMYCTSIFFAIFLLRIISQFRSNTKPQIGHESRVRNEGD